MHLRHHSFFWAFVAIVTVEGGKKGRRKGADYYAILGVEDNANNDELKKAYRAKSMEFHPDKCEQDKEVCQTKFIEMSTAHEVLSDPEKRKTYDEHGEEGLKEGGNGGTTSGEQARQMFKQFFGREPDGNVKIVNRGGQMMFTEEGEPGPKEDIYGDTSVIELSSDVWNSYVHERDEPWVIMFYKPNDDDSVEAKPEYIKFADTFKEFLKVAAVNCRQQRDICAGASISRFPAVRWFPEDKNKPPEVQEGDMSAKTLGRWASDSMTDNTIALQDRNHLRQWLDGAKGPAIVLFTDKSTPPPLWKALSREYKNRLNLGVVLNCDKNRVNKCASCTPLQREYDVRVPQIVRLDPIDELGKIAEKTALIKPDVLKLWFRKQIGVAKKAGPAATFKEWTQQSLEAGNCAASDSQFCFLWLKAGADADVEEATRQLAQKYRTDPIKLMWANVELSPSILEAFGLEQSDSSDFFVAYRPKRGKFKVHTGKLDFPQLDQFVDSVMNGPPLTERLKVQKVEL